MEVLVASAMALIVLTAGAAVLVQGQTDSARVVTKAQAVGIAEIGMRQMVQELDQAYQLEFPTSTANTGCTESSGGVQPCNIADALVRLSSTGFTGTDFEVRYDCTVASTTVSGDRACWRYLCSASASTAANSTCLATSTGLLTKRLVIDDVINGTTASPVFSFCYPNTAATGSSCATGATRATSATVTINVPAAGTLSKAAGGDQTTVVLTDGLYLSDLDLNQ